MSITNVQLAQTPSYTDFPFHNYGGTDIAANVAVGVDASNDISSNNSGVGVAVVANSGDPAIGVTLATIAAGASGTVRCLGPLAQMSADGAITAGVYVEASAATSKKGFAKACEAGKASIGIALNAATSDGDLVLVMLVGGKNA